MRTSMISLQVFYCSIAYSEGGRVNFLDLSAYVIRVWPHTMTCHHILNETRSLMIGTVSLHHVLCDLPVKLRMKPGH